MRRGEGWQRDAIGVVAGLTVLLVVVVATIAFGGDEVPSMGVVIVPAVTAVMARALPTGIVGAVAAVAGLLLAWAEDDAGWIRLVLVLSATALFVLLAVQRERREAKLVEGRTLTQLRGLTALLAGAVTPRDVGVLLSSQGRAVVRASAAVVYVVIDDHLELLASDGYPEGHLADFGRLALDAPAPVTDMIRRRAPLYLSRRTMEADYPAIAQTGVLASKQVLGVPVMLDAEPLGAVFFGYQSTTRLTGAERAMALAIADQAAQALYRARLYEVSLEAEAHVRILQEVTASLADAFTVDTVASVVLRESTERVNAVAAALTLVVPSAPTTLRMAAAVGFPDDVLARWQQFPADAPIPVGDCLEADDLVMIPTRSEMVERYPQLGRETTAERGASGVWVPIPGRRGPVGVVAYFFADERTLGKHAQELFRAIASQCGQALERASLLEAEAARAQRVQLAAELAQQLDTLTAEFSHAVTPAEVVSIFVTTAVTEVGAQRGVMFGYRPGQRSLDVLGAGPAPEATVAGGADERAAAIAAATGSASFVDSDAPDAEALAVVPLTAFGVALGAVCLGFAAPHTFSSAERDHLVLVGQRCGEALERARLYEAERASRVEAQRSAESLAELQSVTATLTGASTSTDVGEAVLDAAIPALEAAAGLVIVQRADNAELAAARHLPGAPHSWGLDQSPHITEVLETGRSFVVERLADLLPEGGTVRGLLAEAGVRSLALVPLRGHDRVVGVLGVGWNEGGPLSPKTSSMLATFAAVCGQALERAALFDAEHAIADTLQRSLLPVLPARLGQLELQGRYRAGTLGTQVGGDWFDAILLPDDRVCLVVGDVEGRGVRAASTMGRLRAALRALTRTTSEPAALLSALNEGLLSTDSPMVTMALAIVGSGGHVAYGYAGHPPLYARTPEGW